MTYRQLEQYLRTEKWRAGAEYGADMCGRYARCAYCDRSSAYPCAYAFDALVRTVGLEGEGIPEWVVPEPPVNERFGTVYAEPDAAGQYQPEEAEPAPQAQAYETPAAQEAQPRKADTEVRKRTIPAPKETPRPRGVVKIEKIAGDACVLKLKRKRK